MYYITIVCLRRLLKFVQYLCVFVLAGLALTALGWLLKSLITGDYNLMPPSGSAWGILAYLLFGNIFAAVVGLLFRLFDGHTHVKAFVVGVKAEAKELEREDMKVKQAVELARKLKQQGSPPIISDEPARNSSEFTPPF